MLTDYYTNFLLEEKSGGGDFTAVTWGAVGTYEGFIQPVGGCETFREGKAGEQVTHRLYTGLSTPAEYGQRVTQSGQSYIVLYGGIQAGGISAVGHHKEVLLGVFK